MQGGQMLLNWRARQGLSQQEVANRIGITRAYVSRLEGGSAKSPSLRVCGKIEAITAGYVPVGAWCAPRQDAA